MCVLDNPPDTCKKVLGSRYEREVRCARHQKHASMTLALILQQFMKDEVENVIFTGASCPSIVENQNL